MDTETPTQSRRLGLSRPRGKGPRVWSDLVAVVKSMGRSNDSLPAPEVAVPRSPKGKLPITTINTISRPDLPSPVSPEPTSDHTSTVVIRKSSSPNGSQVARDGDDLPMSPWFLPILPSPNPSTDISSTFSPILEQSTTKTSIDSRLFSASPERTVSFEKARPVGRRLPGPSTSDGLGTIHESPTDLVKPTIETVERVSAAKIYLETHFHELLSRPTLRELCRQHLESNLVQSDMHSEQKESLRTAFNAQWTWHLRETRVLKTKSARAARGEVPGSCLDDFETLKPLGKGSFGVVKLVSEKPKPENSFRRQVYAMKVIRKSDMIKSTQEGHLRAERDLLVMAEGSNWIVPLFASFQDEKNLYLVMDYMPGGDFLCLLIRENILPESVTRFYIAEMILCVEEAHRLGCIHRDVKPDNFLISSSGHLKISDFGLAFDGHWSHDTGYYNYQRYSLLRQLGITIDGDDSDKGDKTALQRQIKCLGHGKYDRIFYGDGGPLLNWRERCGNRTAANSVVGTRQYMAPEVLRGAGYDGRCDWWSIGIILYECLYGHTPFYSEEGREKTKKNILNHKVDFRIPSRPFVTERCKDLLRRLIQDPEHRLSSYRYQLKDENIPIHGMAAMPYVFPSDGEDIKAHRWFRNIPWHRLHLEIPPFVPQTRTVDDTRYFEDDERISDWSSTVASSNNEQPLGLGEVQALLRGMREDVQVFAAKLVSSPYDPRTIDKKVDEERGLFSREREVLKQFVRAYGRKDKRRPRDPLMRDPKTKHAVLSHRRKTAFLGYTWRRRRAYGYNFAYKSDMATARRVAIGTKTEGGPAPNGAPKLDGATQVPSRVNPASTRRIDEID